MYPSITPDPTTTVYPANTQAFFSTMEPNSTFTATPSATIDPTKLEYWKDEQKLEKNTFDYIRQACGVIDPIPLDARTGTTIDNDFLLKEASLYCVVALTGIGQPELIPACSLITAAGLACHIYNLGFDFRKNEGFYFDNIYRNLTPVPTSANPTETPTITSTSTSLPTPTPIPTITLTPSTTAEK